MRIALDANPLVEAKTGIGHYTDALAQELAKCHPEHNYELLSPFDFKLSGGSSSYENLSKHYFPVRSIFRKWWMLGLPAMLRLTPYDLFHGTNYYVPILANCPTVVTIHDLSLLNQASTHETKNVKRGKIIIPLMARRSTLIIAASESTKNGIIRDLGIKSDKVRVTYYAARAHMRPILSRASVASAARTSGSLSASQVTSSILLNASRFATAIKNSVCAPALQKYKINRPYLLYVGTIEPRKNLPVLIRAYYELRKNTDHKHLLVLAGGKGWLYDEVFKLVEDLKLQDDVIFTGYVDDADLPALYSSADLFLFPSLYEGFGLPPLEAMACGTPVITSNATSLPEVVGNAGMTHDPNDQKKLTQLMNEILSSPQKQQHYILAGLTQSSLFSWERAARETQMVYEEAIQIWKSKFTQRFQKSKNL